MMGHCRVRRLYPFSIQKSRERAGELACLAVMPDYRRSGYGDQLRSHLEARAKKLKLKRLFVLTTRTAHWFIERGFNETDVATLRRRSASSTITSVVPRCW